MEMELRSYITWDNMLSLPQTYRDTLTFNSWNTQFKGGLVQSTRWDQGIETPDRGFVEGEVGKVTYGNKQVDTTWGSRFEEKLWWTHVFRVYGWTQQLLSCCFFLMNFNNIKTLKLLSHSCASKQAFCFIWPSMMTHQKNYAICSMQLVCSMQNTDTGVLPRQVYFA